MQPSVLPDLVRIERIGVDALPLVRAMNRTIFEEERVINSFERDDVRLYLAWAGETPCGFKVGYRESPGTYYSAKGGVLAAFRRRGIARRLLVAMEDDVQRAGYGALAYDTFPNRHPGMVILGLLSGYRIVGADFNPTYRDYRLRLERRFGEAGR